MSVFSDLLDSPLPSQSDESIDSMLDEFFEESGEDDVSEEGNEDFEESDDIDDDDYEESDDADEDYEEGGSGCNGCANEDVDDDLDGISDDEIANEIEGIMDDDPDYPDDLDDELDDLDDDEEIEDDIDDIPEPLDGEEDKKADDLMAIAATPMLIKDELTAEESAKFYESEDVEIAINEGLILESDIDDIYQEGVFANPNKPFKMTKKARYNQLYELSVQIEARMHNDPLYKKLQKAYAIERICKKELRKRYHQLAVKRAKVYLKRLMKSKSGILSNIGKKIGLKK